MRTRQGALLPVLAAAAFLIGGAWFAATANAGDRAPQSGATPRTERPLSAEGNWYLHEETPAAIRASAEKFSDSVVFPNSAESRKIQSELENAEFDPDGLYQEGMADQLYLDTWTCAWAAEARDAAAVGDTDRVRNAGNTLMTRIDLPGQPELNPDWEIMAELAFLPLVEGDYESVSEYWDFQCFESIHDQHLTELPR